MDEKIIFYLETLKNQGKSVNTVDAYRRDLKKFSDFLTLEGIEIDKFEELQIVSYTEYLMETGISKSSIIRNLVTLRNLYKFLRRQGFVLEAPILYYELPKIDRDIPETLSLEEVAHLMEAPDLNTRKGKRDRAILELLYAAGLKVTELINLKVSDVNLTGRYIVSTGPKGSERMIPINHIAAEAVENFLSVRPTMARDGTPYLFTSFQGDTITRQGVWKILKNYASIAGIEGDVSLNTLRHSFAVHLLGNGANINAVSEMMGHSDISITMKYRDMKKKASLMEEYDRTHPREKGEEQ